VIDQAIKAESWNDLCPKAWSRLPKKYENWGQKLKTFGKNIRIYYVPTWKKYMLILKVIGIILNSGGGGYMYVRAAV
jgi:hypothetical protein